MADLRLKEVAATMQLAEEVGIDPEHWDRFRSDPGYRARVARYMQNGATDPWEHQRLGYDDYLPHLRIFGPREWQRYIAVAPHTVDWGHAWSFPWSRESRNYINEQSCPFYPRRELMETHFAFCGFDRIFPSDPSRPEPIDLRVRSLLTFADELALWRRRPKLDADQIKRDWPGLLDQEVRPRWFLMPVMPPESLIPAEYEKLNLAEALLAVILYYQRYGRWLPQACPMLGHQLVVRIDDTECIGMDVVGERLVFRAFSEEYVGISGSWALTRKLPV